jgi:hypothetical protein
MAHRHRDRIAVVLAIRRGVGDRHRARDLRRVDERRHALDGQASHGEQILDAGAGSHGGGAGAFTGRIRHLRVGVEHIPQVDDAEQQQQQQGQHQRKLDRRLGRASVWCGRWMVVHRAIPMRDSR